MATTKETRIEISEFELVQEVTKIMHEIGIPAHIKGYQYVRSAIILAIKNPTVIHSVTKVLYPQVAEMYGTTASRTERAIRHAIECAWNRGDEAILNSYFIEKPTNAEFVATIVDKLNLKYKLR